MKEWDVIMVTENLMEGGAQFFILRLAKALQDDGLSVAILLLNDDQENRLVTEGFTGLNILRLRLPLRRLWRAADKWLFRLRLDFSLIEIFHMRHLRRHFLALPTVFHTHYIKTDYIVGRVLKGKKGFRHVASVHGDYQHQYRHFQTHGRSIWHRLESKYRWLGAAIDQWVVASEEQRRFFTQALCFPPERIEKIYYGFSLPRTMNADVAQTSSFFTIGMAARGIAEKGWQVLIDAFLQLPQNCRLLLAGKGPFLDEMEAAYSSNKRIEFTGYQRNTVDFINRCDVTVLPSVTQTESLPYVVIESLSCGKPVVASDVGEVRMMLTDEETGEIAGDVLPLRDGRVEVKDLYNALLLLVQNRELLNEKSLLAVRASKKFDMGRCVAAYRNAYRLEKD